MCLAKMRQSLVRMVSLTPEPLSRSSADKEPLVYRAVDLLRRKVLVLGEGRQLIGADTRGRLRDGQVGTMSRSGSHVAVSYDELWVGSYVEMPPG